MENTISWLNYWVFVSVISILYYAGVLIVYYRHDFIKFHRSSRSGPLSKKAEASLSKVGSASEITSGDQISSISGSPKEETEIVAIVQSFTAELVAYLEQAGKDHPVKQEILFSVSRLIKKYSAKNLISYQPAINQLLATECEASCSIRLEEQEINSVWKG